MSAWWIVAGGLVLLGVALIIAYKVPDYTWYYDFDWALLPGACCVLVGLLVALYSGIGTASANMNTHLFIEQKAFLENYEPADAVENAAITTKIVELNEWLYAAQYSAERWPKWTLFDEAVLELEPIARK